MSIFDRVSTKNAHKLAEGAPVSPEIAAMFLCAFERLAMYLPESEVRDLAKALPEDEQRVLTMVLARREYSTPPPPLHVIIRKMKPAHLKAWDSLETKLERELAKRGLDMSTNDSAA